VAQGPEAPGSTIVRDINEDRARGEAGGEEGLVVSVGEELCFGILAMRTACAAVSARRAFSVHTEARRRAWGWAATLAVSSLCAAYCFVRLL
jgi:hypothetical protein